MSVTGTGQDLASYQPIWDKPCEVVMAEQGVTLLECWSVKAAMANGGLVLQYPAPAYSQKGWTKYPAGTPIPADWADPGAVEG
jgi:hypothetical protein